MYKFLVCVTPPVYGDATFVDRKVAIVRSAYSDLDLRKLCLVVSYKYFKPHGIGPQTIHRYSNAIRMFGKVVVEHAGGVKWNGVDRHLEALGIEIYLGAAPAEAWEVEQRGS